MYNTNSSLSKQRVFLPFMQEVFDTSRCWTYKIGEITIWYKYNFWKPIRLWMSGDEQKVSESITQFHVKFYLKNDWSIFVFWTYCVLISSSSSLRILSRNILLHWSFCSQVKIFGKPNEIIIICFYFNSYSNIPKFSYSLYFEILFLILNNSKNLLVPFSKWYFCHLLYFFFFFLSLLGV